MTEEIKKYLNKKESWVLYTENVIIINEPVMPKWLKFESVFSGPNEDTLHISGNTYDIDIEIDYWTEAKIAQVDKGFFLKVKKGRACIYILPTPEHLDCPIVLEKHSKDVRVFIGIDLKFEELFDLMFKRLGREIKTSSKNGKRQNKSGES